MKNNKGFTLIEILAVVILLGVIMIIAIPAISESVSDSKKSEFIDSSIKLIDAARIEVTERVYSANNPDYSYYIPTRCFESENGDTTSYGDLVSSYVVITYRDSKYEYYYTGYTDAGVGILLTHGSKLNNDSVRFDVNSIRTDIGIGGRTKIYLYSDACDGTRIQKNATKDISDLGVYIP